MVSHQGALQILTPFCHEAARRNLFQTNRIKGA